MLSLKRRRRLPKLLTGITLLIIVGSSLLLPHLTARTHPAANVPVVAAAQPSQKTGAGLPVRIKIPSIGVDTHRRRGIDNNGDMEAPTGAKDTGWYKLGPRPGNIGSAVIAGHYGRWKNGEASVFDNLNKLAKGDKIFVQDDKSVMIVFVVRESRMLNRNDDAKNVFTSTDNKAHLNLITCQGTWSEKEKTYSKRLVVFADLRQDHTGGGSAN